MKIEIVLALPLRLSMDWLKEWPRISDTPVIISTTNITETAKINRPLLRQKFWSADLGAKRALVNILVVPARGVVTNNCAAVDGDDPPPHHVDDILVVRRHHHGGATLVDLDPPLQDLPAGRGGEGAGGLVRDEERGVRAELPRYREARRRSAGKRLRELARGARESYEAEYRR